MTSICGADCCEACSQKAECGGCTATGGHPFGGDCIAAEWIKQDGMEGFLRRKQALIDEFNALGIPGLQISDLNLLNGFFINLEYPLASGQAVKFLKDNNVYWGNQVEIPGSDRCYGLAACDGFLLVSEYGCGGEHPQLILYKGTPE